MKAISYADIPNQNLVIQK